MSKIADVENVICSAATMARHPELYHYTKLKAFESIVASQTLRCSHYSEMLDHEEIGLMRKLLPPAVAPRMDALMKDKNNFNRQIRRTWKASGGGDQMALDLVNSIYGATFDGKAIYSTLECYLFSFSTHSDDTAFDREHGILSQWDRYAGTEGYCLVFDIGEVAQMLKQEGSLRYWAWLLLEPVRYADQPVEDIFPELVRGLVDTLRLLITQASARRQFGVLRGAVPDEISKQFLAGTTLLKGAGYKSEREVRIVAFPGTAEAAKQAAREYPDLFDATLPLPEIRTRPGTDKRYVALFDGLGLRLPIKRVIVGPGARQDERAERARSMLRDVPITTSRCPLSDMPLVPRPPSRVTSA